MTEFFIKDKYAASLGSFYFKIILMYFLAVDIQPSLPSALHSNMNPLSSQETKLLFLSRDSDIFPLAFKEVLACTLKF